VCKNRESHTEKKGGPGVSQGPEVKKGALITKTGGLKKWNGKKNSPKQSAGDLTPMDLYPK